MPDNYHVEQMIVIVVMAGVTAGSIQSLQASLFLCLIYISLLIVPLSVWIFLQYDIVYTILGISMVLYLLFTLAISVRAYKFLMRTLMMKYENIYLTENVSSSNKKLQQVNQDLIEKKIIYD